MLITFALRNYRSFSKKQSLSFVPSSDRAHEFRNSVPTTLKSVPRLSKVAIFFGPNASGKSNFLQSLSTLRTLVLRSSSFTDAELVALFEPFLFGSSVRSPTEFCIELLIDSIRYRYSVSFDSFRIRAESLYVYRSGKSQRWFHRSYDDRMEREVWLPFSPAFNGPRELWRKSTRQTALYLTVAAQLNSRQLAPLFHWFQHCLEIVLPADLVNPRRDAIQIEDAKLKAEVMAVFRAVGMRVDDVRVAKRASTDEQPESKKAVPLATAAVPGSAQVEFLYRHPDSRPIWLKTGLEALGTYKVFLIAGRILEAIKHNRVLLIDQFDAGLHPLVARYLIELILHSPLNDHKAQMLLTSYNTTLMDLNILRRDEIWLMRLDSSMASVLSPVSQMRARKHEVIARSYLRGRYDAVPSIKPLRGSLQRS